MYVLHRKTVTTNSQNTIVKITKPIHPGVLEGRIGSGRVNDTREGEKSTQISPEAAAGKCLKKTHTHTAGKLWSFQTLGGGGNPHTGVRKIPIQRQGNTQRALGSGSCLPREGEENREKSCHVLPSPFDSRTQWPATAFSLAGEGCGEGNFSAEDELLRADCR